MPYITKQNIYLKIIVHIYIVSNIESVVLVVICNQISLTAYKKNNIDSLNGNIKI